MNSYIHTFPTQYPKSYPYRPTSHWLNSQLNMNTDIGHKLDCLEPSGYQYIAICQISQYPKP